MRLPSEPRKATIRSVGSEFAFIRVFTKPFRVPAAPQGPGDDCAVLPAAAPFCVTTDSVVEGVHFTLPEFTLEEVGHKALAVNLSDLAAMGARPSWFLCALAIPKSFGEPQVKQLATGMSRLARKHRLRLIGGNFTSAKQLALTLTVAGEMVHRPLLRSGAKAGDVLYVSGTLGDAGWGLRLLKTRPRSSAALRQKRPEPRVALGLAVAPFVSAAMDVSDGFAQDLTHLCQASRVGARVELASLPLSPALRRAFPTTRAAALFAASSGEDYELLMAVPPSRTKAFERRCHRVRQRVTKVGVLTRARDISLVDADGRRLATPSGFDHFAERRK